MDDQTYPPLTEVQVYLDHRDHPNGEGSTEWYSFEDYHVELPVSAEEWTADDWWQTMIVQQLAQGDPLPINRYAYRIVQFDDHCRSLRELASGEFGVGHDGLIREEGSQ